MVCRAANTGFFCNFVFRFTAQVLILPVVMLVSCAGDVPRLLIWLVVTGAGKVKLAKAAAPSSATGGHVDEAISAPVVAALVKKATAAAAKDSCGDAQAPAVGVRFNDRVRVRFIPTRVEMASDGYLSDTCWSADDFRAFHDDFLRKARAAGVVGRGCGTCMLRVQPNALLLTVDQDPEPDPCPLASMQIVAPSHCSRSVTAPVNLGGGGQYQWERAKRSASDETKRESRWDLAAAREAAKAERAKWLKEFSTAPVPAALLPRSSVRVNSQRGLPVVPSASEFDAHCTVIPAAVAPNSRSPRLVMPWERRAGNAVRQRAPAAQS